MKRTGGAPLPLLPSAGATAARYACPAMQAASRNTACPLGVSLLASLAALGLVACGGERQRPDVILIVVDTLRADRLSTYGYPRPTAPFLDSLAAEGTLFEDATAQSSWTLPSMVSLFTGRYLTEYRDFIGDTTPTLPESFARAGYRTVGASANILLTSQAGFHRGFDHYDSSPRPRSETQPTYTARDVDELLAHVEAPLRHALRRDEKGKRPPVFLYLQPFDPHDPYVNHERLHDVLQPVEILKVAPLDWQRERFAKGGLAAPENSQNWFGEWRYMDANRAYYDLEVRHTDDRLAGAFELWRELGLLDNTVLAFVSDHGEGLWDHVSLMRDAELAQSPPSQFFYQKHGGHLYEEAVRTPFLLWGAGVPANTRVAGAVENVDLFPTLLELCELPVPGPLHGKSLVPALRGRPPAREFVHSFVLHGTSVRELTTGLKLIQPSAYARGRVGNPVELYDLAVDPEERVNLAPSRPDDVARLAAEIARWHARFPTDTTLGRRPDAARARMLQDLGYTGGHVGEDSLEADDSAVMEPPPQR